MLKKLGRSFLIVLISVWPKFIIASVTGATCMSATSALQNEAQKDADVGKLLTLREAILLSLRYNPDVINAEIQRVSDKFALRVAEWQFQPQYALNGDIVQTFNRTAGDSSSSRTSTLTPQITKNGVYGSTTTLTMNNPTTNGIYNPGVELNIVQPLIRGYGKDVATAQLYNAQQTEKQNKLALRSTLITDVNAVIQAYQQVVSDEGTVEVDQLSLRDYRATIELNQALIKAGRSAPTEVIQAQADYAQAQFQLQQDQNTVMTAKLTLLNLIGLPPETPVNVPRDLPLCQDDLPSIEQAYEIALKNNIGYLNQQIQVKLAERQLLVDEDTNRPQLNAEVDAATGNGTGKRPNDGFRSLTNNKNTNVTSSLTLNVPINNLANEQVIVSDKITLETDRINLANAARQLRLLVQQDIQTVQSNYKSLQFAEQTLALQEKNQQFLRAQLQYGLVSTFEVTTKQQSLDSARVQLVTQKITYLSSVTQLYSDIGILLDKWNIRVRY